MAPSPARSLALGFAGAFVTCVLAACKSEDQKPISATRERSQGVAAAPGPTSIPSAAKVAAPSRAKLRRALCEGQKREAKGLPKHSVSQAAASDAPKLKPSLSHDPGSWTWVNFWAAWCVPCKEEIPRLVEWEQKLQKTGQHLRIIFVSLDDDERQLMQFLAASSRLRSTYWLKEGREREEWMSAAGLDPDPELPVHLLLDPDGKIRCRVQGAVEDSDYESLARLVGGH